MKSKYSVAIIVTVAILLELIFIVPFLFARNAIREDVEHRAESELRVKNLEIPAADASNEDANKVDVYWYVINNSETKNLNYKINSLYIGM